MNFSLMAFSFWTGLILTVFASVCISAIFMVAFGEVGAALAVPAGAVVGAVFGYKSSDWFR